MLEFMVSWLICVLILQADFSIVKTTWEVGMGLDGWAGASLRFLPLQAVQKLGWIQRWARRLPFSGFRESVSPYPFSPRSTALPFCRFFLKNRSIKPLQGMWGNELLPTSWHFDLVRCLEASLGSFLSGIVIALPTASSATTATVQIVTTTWNMKTTDKKPSRYSSL